MISTNSATTPATNSVCQTATCQPRSPVVTVAETTRTNGSTRPTMAARAASQYAWLVVGAFVSNVQAADNSLGTKNDARTPMTTQNAATRGIQNTIVRGRASADRSIPVCQRAAATTGMATAAFIVIIV